MLILPAASLAGAVACSAGSPQPEPAPGDPPLNLAKVSIHPEAGTVSISASAGSIRRLGIDRVWAIGLSTGVASNVAHVESTGSFALTVAGSVEEPYRLHLEFTEALLSEVLDVVASGERLEPRSACSNLSTPLYLGAEDVRVGAKNHTPLLITNSCERSLTAVGVRRVAGPGFISTSLRGAHTIAPLEALSIELVNSPDREGPFHEVIAIEFSDDPPLFVTVKGQGLAR